MKSTLTDRISEISRKGAYAILIASTLSGCQTTNFNFGSKPAIIYNQEEPHKKQARDCATKILKKNNHPYKIVDKGIEINLREATYNTQGSAQNLELKPTTSTHQIIESYSTRDILEEIKKKCKSTYEIEKIQEELTSDQKATKEGFLAILGVGGAISGILGGLAGGSGGGNNSSTTSTPFIPPGGGPGPGP